jgi:hypothetical protein
MSVRRDDVLDLERRFWLGDGAFYGERLSGHAVMVFPEPVGVLDRTATIASLAGAPRWERVEISVETVIEAAPATILLVYRAAAERESDAQAYRALCTSVYVLEEGRLQLALHQQTPLG